jgi:FlaA1/EpsC-like NDP-sugar epimerase
VGLEGLPDLSILVAALILAVLLNIKVLLYFFIFTRFRLRSRTSVFTSLTLANYSEFGLIVGAFAVTAGFLSTAWLQTIALALAFTFFVSSVLNNYAHHIYFGIKNRLHKFETPKRLSYDKAMDIGKAEILIIGMGKLGTAAYRQMYHKYGQIVLGIDYDNEKIKRLKAQGINVSHDDATDGEFWDLIAQNPERHEQVKMIMLCMDSHKSNLYSLERLQAIEFKGNIAAIARFDDQAEELQAAGAHAVYNIYSEAGFGFADHACRSVDSVISCSVPDCDKKV